jgi:hypothetical protein
MLGNATWTTPRALDLATAASVGGLSAILMLGLRSGDMPHEFAQQGLD